MGGDPSERLEIALTRLSDEDRAVLALRFRDGLDDEQAAERLETPTSELMWRRLRLVSELAGEAGREDPAYALTVQRKLAELEPEAWEGALPEPEHGRLSRLLGPGRLAGRGRALGTGALLILPAALLVYLSFNGGGFFAGGPAVAAVAVLVAMVLRVTLADRPFEGFGPGVAVGAVGLGLLAVLALTSAAWSDAPSRALLEFDRVLLYLLVLVLTGSVLRSAARVRWMARGLAAAILTVCLVGLVTRVLPELWPIQPHLENGRLSYPLTYWNASGLLAALGIVLHLWLASDGREPRGFRLLGAAGLPILATTLLLTFSRGGIAAAVLGTVAFAVIARQRLLLTGLLGAGPPTAVALVAVYRADLLGTEDYTSAAAVAQGEKTALVIGLCCAAALLLRALLLPVDRLLGRLRLPIPPGRRRLFGITAAIAGVAAGLLAALALGAPGYVERQYEGFVNGEGVASTKSRERLTNPSANGRIEFWHVARKSWERERLLGQGAGTFQTLWTRQRPDEMPGTDGHSLYLETLAEMGVVGLILLLVVVGAVLLRLLLLARALDRGVYAAGAAMALAWAVHAGTDWDWELPAVTLPFFAVGGLALAGSVRRFGPPARLTRVVIALALILVALTPLAIAASQRALNASVRAFKHGDCTVAIDRALDSLEALDVRPEPYEILGYCDARRARTGRLGVEMMSEAVERDPDNWEFHYGLALARGAARMDPRRSARTAVRLNPGNGLARRLVRRLDTASPQEWEARARAAPPPILVQSSGPRP